ncbi:hypothetical protein, partial [Escherichia coli]|uniref:hypothetical protein n=1 Tax=Escherichia coli TaxID=562 RepID=UPI0021C6A2E0
QADEDQDGGLVGEGEHGAGAFESSDAHGDAPWVWPVTPWRGPFADQAGLVSPTNGAGSEPPTLVLLPYIELHSG